MGESETGGGGGGEKRGGDGDLLEKKRNLIERGGGWDLSETRMNEKISKDAEAFCPQSE